MTALVLARPVALQTIAHHSKSFALASRLLGPRLRDQTAVIYTWCRRADDAVDEGHDPHALGRLHAELDDVYAGRATEPVLAAFGEVVRERAIPRCYPEELLAGMAMDARGMRYDTMDQLLLYAWRVAGVVGLMMTHVFGISDDDALVPAAHLGIAMQLTNICRDVTEDRARGRCYLPAELAGDQRAQVRALLALADRYYASADRGISALPMRAAIAVRVAREVYAAIGDEIAARDYDVTERAVVSARKKRTLAAAAVARIVLTSPARLFARRARVPRRTLELGDAAIS